ncbi:hypothetical protein [Chryseobacterium hispalense]|jgi:hypothetical protein|uniref:hypothetical protein n=1 Tax=Chryseobacterium hispalense TaxID=1453492 RepID=UPI00391CDD3D
MRRNIFNSKKLFIANVAICLIFFTISSLSLYALLFLEKYNLRYKNQSVEILLYIGYITVYMAALILLFVKPIKAVMYLSLTYFLAMMLNFYDFNIHYLKHEKNESRYLLIAIIILFVIIFSSLIYLNNKRKFTLDTSELDTIGKHND